MIGGAILGITVAGAAGWLLGSWLVFALSVVPLVALGMLLGMALDLYAYQRRIIESPAFVDDQVHELVRAGKRPEASRMLLLAARMVEQAAREARPDRDALTALATRWKAEADTLIERDIRRHFGAFRAWRERRRDTD